MNKVFLLFFVALLLESCDSYKVVSDYDKSVDFNQYKSLTYYGWTENSDEILNRFDKERIEKAFGAEFTKRGVEIVEEGGDMVVSLYIVTEQKTQKSASTTHMGTGYGGYGRYYGYGPGWGWGGGYSTTTVHEYDYTVGTLVVSVYDAQKEQLIWEGVGKGTVDENPNTRDKNIPRAVAKIMSKYPMKPVK
jgi:hypothetical protein